MSLPSVSIFSDHVCTLGEGPSYDPATDTLFWFDILNCTMLSKTGPDGATETIRFNEIASAVASVDKERQLLFTESGLHLRDRTSGRLTKLAGIEDDRSETRSNDARVHPSGAFWVGTMGKSAETGLGSIYWSRGGEVRRLFRDLSIPNSICFSPDGRVAYFTDTAVGKMMRVACDPMTGLPNGEPTVLVDASGDVGGPDGSVVDRDGAIWNARWGAGTLDCYSPDGRRLQSIAIPTIQPTCPAFIGPKADRLVVTTAAENVEGDEAAGKTYLIELEVEGQFEPQAVV